MIEAVNSVLANASLLRGSVEQVDVAHAPSVVAQPLPVQEGPSGPQAPYVSPYIHVDINFDKAVLQIRDGETGDVVRQFPSESTLEARRRAEIAKLDLFTPETQETKDFDTTPQVAADTGAVSSEKPAGNGNAQAQVAAAALAASARTGQVSTGAVSVTA